jgi:hypothetical protein
MGRFFAAFAAIDYRYQFQYAEVFWGTAGFDTVIVADSSANCHPHELGLQINFDLEPSSTLAQQ